jgi:nitroreductase
MKQLTKKILGKIGPGAIVFVKSKVDGFRLVILKIVAPSAFLCSLYYLLFDGAFRREHQSVVKGMIKHLESDDESSVSGLLRRNVHRVEKGLIMRPRRANFALDYIGETIDSLSTYLEVCSISDPLSDPILKWALDVLESYFDCQGYHPIVEAAKNKYLNIIGNYSVSFDGLSSPGMFAERCKDATIVDIDILEKFIRARRSVRWYQNVAVDHAKVDRAIELAGQSPSACNRQPFSFKVIDTPDLLLNVSRLPGGTGGWASGIPMIIAVVGDLSYYFNERDRHCIYIDSSLSAMTLIYALQSQGLSSCVINWPDVADLERKAVGLFGLKCHERITMLISVGVADPSGLIPFSAKTSLEEFRKYE